IASIILELDILSKIKKQLNWHFAYSSGEDWYKTKLDFQGGNNFYNILKKKTSPCFALESKHWCSQLDKSFGHELGGNCSLFGTP
ncbi:hypothetical protein AVEN_91693-1, partial [Araneus ventricosus]